MTQKKLSWGEEIWEEKIKVQGELGVVSGTNGSLSNLKKRTISTLDFMEKNVFNSIKKNSQVLDLGVGPMARLAIPIAKKGFDVIGVDISPTTIKYAKDYSERAKAKITFLQDDLITLNSIKSSFDFIYCVETFEHIPKHLSLLSLKKINSILKNDGLFLIEFSVEEKKSIFSELFKFFYFLGHKIKSTFTKTFSVTCYSYTSEEISDLLKRARFKIIARKNGLFLTKKI